MSCCLMTTLERICREELTTAAQVSSAEDSIARMLRRRESVETERRNIELNMNQQLTLTYFVTYHGPRLGQLRPPSSQIARTYAIRPAPASR